jgi:hypothetical protein
LKPIIHAGNVAEYVIIATLILNDPTGLSATGDFDNDGLKDAAALMRSLAGGGILTENRAPVWGLGRQTGF